MVLPYLTLPCDIQYDTEYSTCAKTLTGSHLNLLQGI